MDYKYRNFCIKYNEKLKIDSQNKADESGFSGVDFYLHEITTIEISHLPVRTSNQMLFRLDNEDLAYLHNKYSKFVQSEMEDNLEKLKETYLTCR